MVSANDLRAQPYPNISASLVDALNGIEDCSAKFYFDPIWLTYRK